MNRDKFRVLFFSLCLFSLLFFSQILAACDTGCPPTDTNCRITCGGTKSSQSTSTTAYWNYTLTSPYMNVTLELTNANIFTDYDLHASWTAEECPSGSGDGCFVGDEGEVDKCNHNITAGTYISSVQYITGPGTYTLGLSCEDYCDDQCPPDPKCNITCGQTLTGWKTGSTQYIYYTLDSTKKVTITLESPQIFTDYDLHASWTAEECPSGSGDGCTDGGQGGEDICINDVQPGAYLISVTYDGGPGTYDLTLSCEDYEITGCSNLNVPGATYYLKNNILDSGASTCMDITANNITLDCQGNTIDGVGDGYGIQIDRGSPQSTGITIRNCSVTDWYRGVVIYNSYNNIITNSSLLDNGDFDLYVYTDSDDGCNNVLYNVTGTDDKPIVYYNSSATIQDWDNNVSEIILCNADNSVINNLNMKRTGTKNNAIRLVRTDYTTISNTEVENHQYGILLYTSSNNLLRNITISSNDLDGIPFSSSSNNNQLINITSISNGYDGIYLVSSSNNVINNSIMQDNNLYGIELYDSGNPENKIYNNLLNNTNNFYLWDDTSNSWNITRQNGKRIYSFGTNIGGNYLTDENSNGQSDNCIDSDTDGFCDKPYDLYNIRECGPGTGYTCSDNTDYELLSDEWRPPGCDEIITGTDTIFTISQSNKVYCLVEDKHRTGGTAIEFAAGVQNSILDCRGYKLNGNGDIGTLGVIMSDSENKNNTIKNCNITSFEYAIFLSGGASFDGPSNITIVNNTVANNTIGIYVEYSQIAGQSAMHIISNNTVNNNTQSGIKLYLNSNNTIENNTLIYNPNGIEISKSSNNTITKNTIKSGNNYGIYIHDNSEYNTLKENIIKEITEPGNQAYGIGLFSGYNILINNNVNSNSNGLYLNNVSSNNITDGSIASNTESDYYLYTSESTNYFRNTNFTEARNIRFFDVESWFNYNNETTDGIWLKTNVSSGSTTITRELTSWTQSLMEWKDSATGIIARYNITGLNPNKIYGVYDNNQFVTYNITDDQGSFESFTIDLSSEHEIKVQEEYLLVDSIATLPPDPVYPLENGTRIMNVTIDITNSTSMDKCIIRVIGPPDADPPDSYSDPAFGPFEGDIRIVDSTTQCNGTWGMEYWRNPGGCDNNCLDPWNVSVDLNLTNGISNFTSKNFIYNPLSSTIFEFDTINFTGSPDETVNSTNAYPIEIYNRGNANVYVYINGSDLTGETYTGDVIGVGNISYNETETGIYKNLTHDNELAIYSFYPTETAYLYFKAYIPLGFRAQLYNNTINYDKTGDAMQVCNICHKFGSCAPMTTSLGDNLYGCEGSDKRCEAGECITETAQPKQPDSNWYNTTQNDPMYRPPARKKHAMTYASDYDRAILFGGDDSGVNFNDTWIFNYTDSKWYNVTKPGSPSARTDILNAMAYDSDHDRVILFGGYSGGRLGDTWEFNFSDYKWYNRNPSVSPSARNWANLVYVSTHQRIVLYGGRTTAPQSDTWIYNYSDNKWYDVTNPSCQPPAREYTNMVYDSDADRIIMYGGTIPPPPTARPQHDTWVFNYTDKCWYNVTNVYNAGDRDSHGIAYDSESTLTIIHGGGIGYKYDTWAFNYTDKKWYNITAELETIPTGANDITMTYIGSVNDRVVRYGGQIGSNIETDQTWLLNYTSGG